jgi:RNA polymerase sigma-70 factor, ECF subfamily
VTDVPPDSAETRQLLDQIEQGRPAFDRLFERHRKRLHDAVGLRLDAKMRARVDASDVVQETQIDAFRRLADFLDRQPMPFHLWLRKTAYERLIMLRRKHIGASQRAVERELPLPEHSAITLGHQLVASGTSPSQQVSDKELAHRVRHALAQLSELDREILLMRTYEGLSYDEIACILEVETATARKRNGRALIRLHRLLTEGGITESQV